ncbi:unnamed protein product [Ixodes pacificus]
MRSLNFWAQFLSPPVRAAHYKTADKETADNNFRAESKKKKWWWRHIAHKRFSTGLKASQYWGNQNLRTIYEKRSRILLSELSNASGETIPPRKILGTRLLDGWRQGRAPGLQRTFNSNHKERFWGLGASKPRDLNRAVGNTP